MNCEWCGATVLCCQIVCRQFGECYLVKNTICVFVECRALSNTGKHCRKYPQGKENIVIILFSTTLHLNETVKEKKNPLQNRGNRRRCHYAVFFYDNYDAMLALRKIFPGSYNSVGCPIFYQYFKNRLITTKFHII